jgi:hypothetical protein
MNMRSISPIIQNQPPSGQTTRATSERIGVSRAFASIGGSIKTGVNNMQHQKAWLTKKGSKAAYE